MLIEKTFRQDVIVVHILLDFNQILLQIIIYWVPIHWFMWLTFSYLVISFLSLRWGNLSCLSPSLWFVLLLVLDFLGVLIWLALNEAVLMIKVIKSSCFGKVFISFLLIKLFKLAYLWRDLAWLNLRALWYLYTYPITIGFFLHVRGDHSDKLSICHLYIMVMELLGLFAGFLLLLIFELTRVPNRWLSELWCELHYLRLQLWHVPSWLGYIDDDRIDE